MRVLFWARTLGSSGSGYRPIHELRARAIQCAIAAGNAVYGDSRLDTSTGWRSIMRTGRHRRVHAMVFIAEPTTCAPRRARARLRAGIGGGSVPAYGTRTIATARAFRESESAAGAGGGGGGGTHEHGGYT